MNQHKTELYCASHNLNWSLINGLAWQDVKNCLTVLSEVTWWFKKSAIAPQTLKGAIPLYVPESKKKRLTSMCETKFIEWHTSVLDFVELLEPIYISMIFHAHFTEFGVNFVKPKVA